MQFTLGCIASTFLRSNTGTTWAEWPGRYDILKGQCEAARAAYIKERKTVISALSENERRYGVAIDDNSY